VHADSQKLSGVYAMSDEDTMDWDEEPIDWESLFAEVTETNEANSDSVATLELSEIAPSVFDAMHKALIDQCEKDGYATSDTVDAEAVDELLLATFGAKKGKRGLTGEQLQQIREDFVADDKGNPARYAKLAAAIGCSVSQLERAVTELRRECGKVRITSSKLTGEQRQQIREHFVADETGSAARCAQLAAAIGGGCTQRQVKDEFTKLRAESGKVRITSSKLTGDQRQQIREEFVADDKGGPARCAELAAAIGGGCTQRQVKDEFTKLRHESGKVKSSKLTGEQRQQIREEFAADDKGNSARYAELAAVVGGGCTQRQVSDAFAKLRRESDKVQQKKSAKLTDKTNEKKAKKPNKEKVKKAIWCDVRRCACVDRQRRSHLAGG
jgi:alkylated DNA nucleotide flippase Atl1